MQNAANIDLLMYIDISVRNVSDFEAEDLSSVEPCYCAFSFSVPHQAWIPDTTSIEPSYPTAQQSWPYYKNYALDHHHSTARKG
jgi:hypothetical protein